MTLPGKAMALLLTVSQNDTTWDCRIINLKAHNVSGLKKSFESTSCTLRKINVLELKE